MQNGCNNKPAQTSSFTKRPCQSKPAQIPNFKILPITTSRCLSPSSSISMSGNRDCTVYVGNLDERVSERVLYDILIQAGRVVDLHVPKDRETDKPKGYAFAEYESEEIANYAVKLFSGLVTLYSRTLKFAISGQDKASANNGFGATRSQNQNYRLNGTDMGDNYGGLSASYRFSTYSDSSQASLPPAMTHENLGHRSRSNGTGYEYSQRVLGGTLDSINPNRSRRYDSSNSVSHSPHYSGS